MKVYRGIIVDVDIPERDDLAKVRHTLRTSRIDSRQLHKCFPDNLQLAFNRRSQNDVAVEVREALVHRHGGNCIGRIEPSHRKLFGSRRKHWIP